MNSGKIIYEARPLRCVFVEGAAKIPPSDAVSGPGDGMA